jgi:hypothetical protein
VPTPTPEQINNLGVPEQQIEPLPEIILADPTNNETLIMD